MLEHVIAKAGIKHSDHILDIGCGTGNLEQRLYAKFPLAQVTGIDSASAMLSRAKHKARPDWFKEIDLNKSLSSQGVLGHYNVIFATNVLYTLSNPSSLIKELAELSSPGAVMVASTPKAGARLLPILTYHHREIKLRDGRYSRVRLTASLILVGLLNIVIIRRGEQGSYCFASKADLHEWFAHSGWRIVEISETYAGQDWLVVAKHKS